MPRHSPGARYPATNHGVSWTAGGEPAWLQCEVASLSHLSRFTCQVRGSPLTEALHMTCGVMKWGKMCSAHGQLMKALLPHVKAQRKVAAKP